MSIKYGAFGLRASSFFAKGNTPDLTRALQQENVWDSED